jgi:hypothetical protein
MEQSHATLTGETLCSIPPISWKEGRTSRYTNRRSSLRLDTGRWIDPQVSYQPNTAEIHTTDGWWFYSLCRRFQPACLTPASCKSRWTYSGPQPTDQQSGDSSFGRRQTGAFYYNDAATTEIYTRSHSKETIWVGLKKENIKVSINWFQWYKFFPLVFLKRGGVVTPSYNVSAVPWNVR